MNRQKLSLTIAWLAPMLAFTALGLWGMVLLRDPDVLAVFQERIASLGIGGWVVLLAAQYVQVLLVFVPGGPMQVVAGALYGPLGGLAVILVGIVLATATIFAIVRRYGDHVLRMFVEEETISKYKFLSAKVKLTIWVVVLFLIPGSPSSALTYIFALTPMTFWKFTFLSIIARMPGILVSVFAGDSIVQGVYWRAVLLLGGIALLGLAGIFIKSKFGESAR